MRVMRWRERYDAYATRAMRARHITRFMPLLFSDTPFFRRHDMPIRPRHYAGCY